MADAPATPQQGLSKPERNPDGTLKKGSTANPAGRAKDPEWLSERGPMALKFIDDRIYDDDVDMALRIKAAQIISERWYGKPKEQVEHTGEVGHVTELRVTVVRPAAEKVIEGVTVKKAIASRDAE